RMAGDSGVELLKPPSASPAAIRPYSHRTRRTTRQGWRGWDVFPPPSSLPTVPAVGMPVSTRSIVPWPHNHGRGWDDDPGDWRDDNRQGEGEPDPDPGVGREGQGQRGKTQQGDYTHGPDECAQP